MNKKVKIALGIGIPVVLFGIYWYTKKPYLSFEKIDWLNKSGMIRFGGKDYPFRVGQGLTAESRGYRLSVVPSIGKIIFNVSKNGRDIDTTTIDFESKLKY